MARLDPHSYNDDTQVETRSLAFVARVDFATRTLHAEVTLAFATPGGGTLDLDTRGLAIEAVEDATGAALPFVLHPADPVLGARLAIELPAVSASVRIRYQTSPEASALQWLEPSQTSGGVLPFLFSQCQAIHARSVMPLQDTPRLRIRYTAELTVPRAMRALVAAAHRGREEAGDVAIERYEMPQAIPPYLFAFAVGDLVSQDVSPRSRVWAEPAMLERSAHEFGAVEETIRIAETLFGPYDWDRYDILTMPPSFPYGGMENPRLTFATPTMIAGDRSLMTLIAHELAHSWTGNLVTNANAEHFWLNEGFTVYAERRILEAMQGEELAALHAALGRRTLEAAITSFAKRPAMTRLRTQLAGVDPDDAYSQVPYQKGASFLTVLERIVGRPRFDAWLRAYLAAFAYRAVTTDDFVAHFERAFPGVLAQADAAAWIDGEGLPANAPRPTSARLDAVMALAATGTVPPRGQATQWTPTEWQLYLDALARPAAPALCETLDDRFGLTRSDNYEILVAWLALALESGHHDDVMARVDDVLVTVGRMKFLRPLYKALASDPRTRAHAHAIYAQAKAGYHPIARQVVEGVLRDAG